LWKIKYLSIYLPPILHRFQVIATWSRFTLTPSLGWFPANIVISDIPLKTRFFGLHFTCRTCRCIFNHFLSRCMECRPVLAMRILSVCLSVRPSVRHTRELWQNGRKICPDLYTMWKNISLVFWEEEWLVGSDPSTWNFGSTGPRWSKIAYFEPIIARSASAVTPSEKSSTNANRKSTTRFPMSSRWSSYVVPKCPKGGWKTQNGRFPLKKIGLRLKKVCYKVSLCENCQR